MARVNTKFLLIIFIVVSLVGLGAGGLYMLNLKNDMDRHIRLGDAFMEQGEYSKAHTSYGRAVTKVPGNVMYLDKFRESLLAITPENREEARKLYNEYMSVLGRAVTYMADDPQTYIDMLEEIHFAARHTPGASAWWVQMEDEANRMLDRFAEGEEPRSAEARLYRGLSRFRRALQLEAEQLEEANDDLEAYLAYDPTSDLGWAMLLQGHVVRADKARSEDDPAGYEQSLAAARSTLELAETNGIAGPHFTHARLVFLALQFIRSQSDPNIATVTRAEIDAATAEYVDAIAASAGADPMFLSEATNLFLGQPWLGATATIEMANGNTLHGAITREHDDSVVVVPRDGGAKITVARSDIATIVPSPQTRMIELVEAYLAENPDRHLHRDRLSQIYLDGGKVEKAEEHCEHIMSAEMGTVGFLTQYLDQLQHNAAARLVDAAIGRWDRAESDERPAILQQADDAMTRFEEFVHDPATDGLHKRAVGKIAYARGNYAVAAAAFDELSRRGSNSREIMTYASRSLERIGETGRAYRQMAMLQARYPLDPNYLAEAGRLALTVGLYDAALDYADELLQLDPDSASARRIRIAVFTRDGDPEDAFDEVTAALTSASKAIEDGDFDTAEATLLGVIEANPDDLQLLNGMLQVELGRGRLLVAKQWTERMLALNPENEQLIRLNAALGYEDLLEAAREFVNQRQLSEAETAVALVMNFASIAAGQRSTAARFESLGRDAEAATARDLADRAQAATDEALVDAIRLAPESPRVVGYRFRQAISDDDLAAAEQLISTAVRIDADQAEGDVFKGQLAAARGQHREAVRHFESAAEKLPFSSSIARQLASSYVEVGDFAKAGEAFENAYGNNPNDAATARQYIALLMRVGDDARAHRIAATAYRLMPGNIVMRETWLVLEDRVGDKRRVLEERRELFVDDPRDRSNAAQLATFLVRTVPSELLILDDAGEPRFAHGRWVRLREDERNEIIAEERTKWHAEADAILASLDESFPGADTVGLRSMLLRERGDIEGGARVLRDALDAGAEGDDEFRLRLNLGRYYAGVGRHDRAIATIREARALQDPTTRHADLALGDLYFQTADYEMALRSLNDAAAVNDDPAIGRRIAECMVRLEMFDEAQARVEQSIAAGRSGYEEQMLLAAIAEARGARAELAGEPGERYFAASAAALEEASRLMPTQAEPHIQRANNLLAAFNRSVANASPTEADEMRRQSSRLDDALSQLERADQVRFGHPQTSLIRVAVLRAKKDASAAIGELTRLLERMPDQIEARRLLVQLHYANQDEQAALRVLDEGIARNDTLQGWHLLRGDLSKDMARRAREEGRGDRVVQRMADAVEAYERAFTISADHTAAERLANAYFTIEPPRHADAERVLRGLHEQNPEDAIFASLLARALNGAGNRAAALSVLESAFPYTRGLAGRSAVSSWYVALEELFRGRPASEAEAFMRSACNDSPEPRDLQWIARYWLTNDRASIERVIDLQRQAISLNAGQDTMLEITMTHDLAQFLIVANLRDEAAEAFARVVELAPNLKGARNNYAYLLAEVLQRPKEALPHANAAVSLLTPSDRPAEWASFLDTRGWVRYLDGDITGAEEDLRASLGNVETTSNTFHLAKLLDAKGSYAAAFSYVSRAAELAADLPEDSQTRNEINALADDIRTKRSQR